MVWTHLVTPELSCDNGSSIGPTLALPLARLSLILDPFPFNNLDLSLARRSVNGLPLMRRTLQTKDSPHPSNCTLPAQGDIRKSFDRFNEVRLEVSSRRERLNNGAREHRQSSSLDERVSFCKRPACALLFVDIKTETSNENNHDWPMPQARGLKCT